MTKPPLRASSTIPTSPRSTTFGQVDGSHYIALEFVDGKPLRTMIDRAHSSGAMLPIEMVVYVIMEVCRGLSYAHDRKNAQGQPLNIVHRDVSPQNILISYDGRVKLIDFGIAKAAGKITRTQAGMIKGKVGYMSPEQVLGGHIDRRADIYALGICLWEALTCLRLYDGTNELAVMNKIRSETVQPPSRANPRIPASVDPIVLKALAKDPNQRYATASEFEGDLRAFARTLRTAGDPATLSSLMRQMFPQEAARASGQENNRMSEKGGSDLDVFDGLAKKSTRPTPAPQSRAPAPPPPSKKTLLGLPPPMPQSGPGRSSGPPGPPPSLRSGPPGPPPSLRSGAPPPSRAPGPPPSKAGSGLPPPPIPPSRSPSGRPGPLPPKPPPAAAAPVDMDWDDEDEKTAIFDKQNEEAPSQALLKSGPAPAAGAPSQRLGGAAALLTGSGGTMPPATIPGPGPMSRPPGFAPPNMGPPPSMGPGSMPGQQMPPSIPTPPVVPMQYPSPAPSGGAGRMVLLAAAAILAIGLIAAMVVFFIPRKGTLVVTVAGPGNKSVDTVQVLVDGTKRCDTSPCRVTELSSGTHMVKVTAAGYQATADQAVKVQTSEDAVLNVTLSRASEGTGIRVTADTVGLVKLYVDGKEIGPLPQELKDLAPGEHVVKIAGERYEAWEKRINIEPEKVQTIEPRLKVVKGLATIKAGNGAQGARVLLVSGNERRPVPNKLPIKIDITTDKPWSIIATRSGYEDFKQDISFQDGKAEETFVIEMYEKGKKPPPKPPVGAHVAGGGTTTKPPGPEKPPAASGTGTLNINSIPVSNVILDGRPLGTTPKVGLSVSAGPHSVVFVHPEHGRKSRGVTVPAGGSVTAAVRFP